MPRLGAEAKASIIEYSRGGAKPAAIARTMGLNGQTVKRLVAAARHQGEPIPVFRKLPALASEPLYIGRLIVRNPETLAAIDRAASKRSLTRQALLARLVEAAAEVMDAVLDDG